MGIVHFNVTVYYLKKPFYAIIRSSIRSFGKVYEVNIREYPRFHMQMSPLERLDIMEENIRIPDELVLALSDAILQTQADS